MAVKGLLGFGEALAKAAKNYGNQPLPGAPMPANVPGAGPVNIGPNPAAEQAAIQYSQVSGIPYTPVTSFMPADPQFGARVAREYELMPHDPTNRRVQQSYGALADEIAGQYEAMLRAGIKPEFNQNPYPQSPYLGLMDMLETGRLQVYPTRAGFGMDDAFDSSQNLLLAESPFKISGQPATYNDLFRAVHDFQGHAKVGAGFRGAGEEMAYLSHAGTMSPDALKALASETRGQNSWLNYGPFGDANRTAGIDDTVFAEQKSGLLPNWAIQERLPELNVRRQRFNELRAQYDTGLEGAIDDSGNLTLVHYSPKPIERVDPNFYGKGLSGRTREELNRSYSEDFVPRSYYGIEADVNPYAKELGLGSNKVETQIDAAQIYDAKKDPEGLWKDGKGDVTKSEKNLWDKGYSGYFVNNQRLGKVAAIFDPLDVTKKLMVPLVPTAAAGLTALAPQEAEAAPTGLLRNVFPAPQRMFDPADKAYKPFLESFGQTPGGRYLEMGPEGPKDITGEYPASAALGVGPDGKPKFQVAPEQATNIPEPKGPGRKIKTNLAKKKTGWKWTQAPEGYDPNPDGGFPIVSVNDGKDHYYTLNTDFPEGVELARYPNEASEPRLKPTRKGHVNLGKKVGEIEMRGKKHPVYDNITIRQAAPVAMTGLLGAGMSEDSDASILGSLSKLGAGRQDLLGMAQKMANEGMDVQSIRERTGWEIGADGQWRTELPNTNTKINIPEVAEGSQYYSGTIADVIDDPELLSQYAKGGRKPTVRDMEGEIEEYGSRGIFGSLGDIAFTVDKNMPEGQGFHREGYFDQFGEMQPETIVISGKSSPAEQRATLLHELQHSIQDREGFAAGGNQKQFAEEERIKDSFYQRVGLAPPGSDRLQELEQKISDAGQRSMSLQEMSDLERLRVEKQISDRFNADTVGEAGARSPYGMYRGLMGEVEARNVETRDRMRPDSLRETPLELSEDVFEPRSQQIFRAGSDDELFRELEYLKYPDVRSNVPEYREAPVVQEQSFGDMVNEYANINQRAQAAEAQKFGLLMREDARLREMGSAAFGQVSPELAAYRRSQMLPTIGEIGMGALEGAVDTLDFVSQLPTARFAMAMPKRTPLRDRLGGLLDYSFVNERDQRARDEARLIGGLLSPI